MEYSFSAKSWHVKLYKFLWLGCENPVYKYNTMCPYFWMSVLGVVLSPILILRTTIMYFGSKVEDYFYDRKVSIRRAKWKRYIDAFEALADKTEKSLVDFVSKYGYNDDAIVDHYRYEEEGYKMSNELRMHYKYLQHKKEEKCNEDSAKFQEKIDAIIYNKWVSRFFSAVVTGGAIYVAYWIFKFFYWLLHLFTFAQFIQWTIMFVVGAVVGFILFWALYFIIKGIIIVASKLFNNINTDCEGVLNTWFLRPISTFFSAIWIFIAKVIIFLGDVVFTIFDLIKGLYNRSCPRLTWKK